MVYITSGLLTALLEIAADRDPQNVSVALAVSKANTITKEIDDPEDGASGETISLDDIPPDAAVFTDMYLPETGRSVTAVFGMDLSTPGAAGRFISHPEGPLALTKRDDLHEVVFVAVPPYELSAVSAFDRSGNEVQFYVVNAIPPEAHIDTQSESQ